MPGRPARATLGGRNTVQSDWVMQARDRFGDGRKKREEREDKDKITTKRNILPPYKTHVLLAIENNSHLRHRLPNHALLQLNSNISHASVLASNTSTTFPKRHLPRIGLLSAVTTTSPTLMFLFSLNHLFLGIRVGITSRENRLQKLFVSC